MELAGLLRGFGLVLGGERELILLVSGQLPALGDIFRRRAHMIAVEGIPEPILDHAVDHLEITHLLAGSEMGDMG